MARSEPRKTILSQTKSYRVIRIDREPSKLPEDAHRQYLADITIEERLTDAMDVEYWHTLHVLFRNKMNQTDAERFLLRFFNEFNEHKVSAKPHGPEWE